MAQYEPVPPPSIDNLQDMLQYVFQELRLVSQAFEGVESITLPKLYVEPDKKVDGMLAYADGTEWDPGAGIGIYRWNGSAWIFLG